MSYACRACGCPSYSAYHFVRVLPEDEDQLMKMYGFRPSSPPQK